jgi:hypothetical protein
VLEGLESCLPDIGCITLCTPIDPITTFSDNSSSKTTEYSAGGGSDSSTKIKVPLNLNASKAIVDFTGEPVFFTTERRIDVMFVNDISGSMDENCGPDGIAQPGELPCKINQLKISANELVDILLVGTNKIGLVSYSTTVVDFTPLTDNSALLHSEINSYEATDRTCVSCGIQKGRELIASGTNLERHIILMSDGFANQCLSGGCVQLVAKHEAVKEAKDAWETYGIHVHAIAFTGASDNATMLKISQVGNGTFHFAEEENLTDVFMAIAQEITRSDPSDTTLDLGNNGVLEWTHPGSLLSTDQVSFVDELNSIDCSCPACVVMGDSCVIDMKLSSETAGKIIADNLTIEGCILTQLPLPNQTTTTTTTIPPTTTTLPGNQTTTTTLPSEGHVVINEFVADPVSGNSADEWIELYNPTSSPVNLNNWTITEGAGQVTVLSGTILPSGFFTIINPNGILNNDGDKLTLKDSGGIIVDMVAYGNFNDSNTADNAPAAEDPESVGRKADGLDTNVDSSDFRIFECPTQNASNIDVCGVPVAPANLQINLVSGNVVITWTASPNAAGYNVYFASSVNGFNFAAPNATVNTTSYTDTAHLSSKERYYIIRAFGVNGTEETNQNKVGKFTYNLVKVSNSTGKNWITIPLNNSIKTAKDVFSSVGSNASAISRLNPFTQTTQSFLNIGDGIGNNFSIVQGEGYELHVAGNTTWTIVGKPFASAKTLTLIKQGSNPGNNWIGLPVPTTLTDASSVLSSVGVNATSIKRLDPSTQSFVQWNGTGTNFQTKNGEGYEISVSGTTIWTPV